MGVQGPWRDLTIRKPLHVLGLYRMFCRIKVKHFKSIEHPMSDVQTIFVYILYFLSNSQNFQPLLEPLSTSNICDTGLSHTITSGRIMTENVSDNRSVPLTCLIHIVVLYVTVVSVVLSVMVQTMTTIMPMAIITSIRRGSLFIRVPSSIIVSYTHRPFMYTVHRTTEESTVYYLL
jgi:hypothetical protein